MNGPNVLSFTLSNVLPVISKFIDENKKTVLSSSGEQIICDAVKDILPENVIFLKIIKITEIWFQLQYQI